MRTVGRLILVRVVGRLSLPARERDKGSIESSPLAEDRYKANLPFGLLERADLRRSYETILLGGGLG